jgi:hypothetical protein
MAEVHNKALYVTQSLLESISETKRVIRIKSLLHKISLKINTQNIT